MKLAEKLNQMHEANTVSGAGVVDDNKALGKNPLDFAIVTVKGEKDKVYVTPNTKLSNKLKKFTDLKVGMKVVLEYKMTSRGFEATEIKDA